MQQKNAALTMPLINSLDLLNFLLGPFAPFLALNIPDFQFVSFPKLVTIFKNLRVRGPQWRQYKPPKTILACCWPFNCPRFPPKPLHPLSPTQ